MNRLALIVFFAGAVVGYFFLAYLPTPMRLLRGVGAPDAPPLADAAASLPDVTRLPAPPIPPIGQPACFGLDDFWPTYRATVVGVLRDEAETYARFDRPEIVLWGGKDHGAQFSDQPGVVSVNDKFMRECAVVELEGR